VKGRAKLSSVSCPRCLAPVDWPCLTTRRRFSKRLLKYVDAPATCRTRRVKAKAQEAQERAAQASFA
jgi:hypothetical protein